MKKEYYVYILRCADGSYYTGMTNDYQTRINEHNEGLDDKSYTFKRRPVTLAYLGTFGEVTDAIAFESQVKGWSRKKKEALIEHNQEELERLAECQNESHARNSGVMVSGDEP